MARDILARWREHVRWLLGGGYQLHDPSELRRGQKGPVQYFEASDKTPEVLIDFVANQTPLALANLKLYELYWAKIDGASPKLLRSVESALIYSLKQSKQPNVAGFLQNDRCSVTASTALHVRCHSNFVEGHEFVGIEKEFTYGTAE